MSKRKESFNPSKPSPEIAKPLSQTQFINLIFQTNIENNKTKIKNLFLEKKI